MKTISSPKTRVLSFVLAMLMLLGTCLTACQGSGEDTSTGGENPGSDAPVVTTPGPDSTAGGDETTNTTPDPGKIPYTVEIITAGGLKLKDITVLIYSDSTLTTMNGYAKTNENGVAEFQLPKDITTFHAVLDEVPEGYGVADSYPLSGSETKITLTSAIIENSDLSGVKYKLGDIMRDFTVTKIDGTTFTLSEALKTKKAVLINFWYVTCSWCEKEFPYLDATYREYKDDIEVIAINPSSLSSDSLESIKLYVQQQDLSFPVAKVDTSLAEAFNVEYYPTSIVIDRYGMISVIEQGAITYPEPFEESFKHFKADNYTQRIEESLKAFVEVPKPTVQMPDSNTVAGAVSGPNAAGITYRAETDPQFVETIWQFDLVDKDGVKCLASTNKNAHGTTSLLYIDVELKAGQALKFDYFSSTEQGADILHVIIDDVRIYQISGTSQGWETCYPYVAIKDGKYTIAIAYIKDTTTHEGEDTVYLKNFDICNATDIAIESFIPRNCATDRKEDGYGYKNYVDIVFNENDGYYHVGTADGPLLLANLMGYNTPFSQESVFDLIYAHKVVVDGVDYYEQIVTYCNYATNATVSGVCTVDKTLAEYLKIVALACGLEVENDKQWLQMCVYYDVYGTDKQLEDPIKGLSGHSAYTAVMGETNVVTYDRVIHPRGLHYKFVPEKSGAYRITSYADQLVEAWIFDQANIELDSAIRKSYHVDEGGDRMHTDPNNCSMVVYFEAGQAYYINIVFWDMYHTGSIPFEIEFIAETYDHFTIASPGYFTFIENESGVVINETIAGGIDVMLGEDGYYHELRADGSLGSILYADFIMTTPIFPSNSILDMIGKNGFNFMFTENDLFVLNYYINYNFDANATKEALKIFWADDHEEYFEIYKVEEVLAGIYHGTGEDYSEIIRSYEQFMIDDPAHPELNGCVPVDAKLAEILQMLMDKYTFEGVDHSWTKVCYYYKYIGAPIAP